MYMHAILCYATIATTPSLAAVLTDRLHDLSPELSVTPALYVVMLCRLLACYMYAMEPYDCFPWNHRLRVILVELFLNLSSRHLAYRLHSHSILYRV